MTDTIRRMTSSFLTFLTILVLVASSTPASALQVTTRASASAGQAATNPLVINKPAGTTAGDVMVGTIGYRPCSSTSGGGCTTSISPPAGWTLIRLVEQTTGGGTGGYGLRLATYYKVATAAEPASYTWTFGGSPTHNGAAGVISSFINVDTTSPIVIESGQATPSSYTHTAPSLGVLATNTMLVSIHAALSSGTWTPPPGMTEILDWASQTVPSDVGMSLEINTEQRPLPGNTGTRTATLSNPPSADAGATHILALRPIQADPTITMGRSSPTGGNLIVGSTASYLLTIGNNGPQSVSAANIAVTDTLPAGLTYTSVSGTGWACSAAGQVVTCTYSGSTLVKGATLPVLSLNVNVVSGTAWTNTATVSSGADGDNDLTNSTATDTWPTVITTLATGSDPAAGIIIAPSALATDVDAFTLVTSVAGTTEPISSVTINLSSNQGVDTVAITNSAGTTIYGSVTLPASGSVTIPVIGMTATSTVTTFKVRVTPLAHVSMPVPPGNTYTVTAPVTGWSGPAAHQGADTNLNALTIDNLSPNSATAVSGATGVQKTTLNWTTSSSTDFATSSGSVVLRWNGSSAGSEVPIEGSLPLAGQSNGTATVACVNSSARNTAVSVVDGSGASGGCQNTALVSGQQYTYKVFQKDSNGNYDVGVVVGSFGASNPTAFNAFETATAVGSTSGVIKTKIAGSIYSLDLVALNGSAVLGSFSGGVTVELVANNSSVALDASNCPVSGTTIAVGTASITNGRSTFSFPAVADAWRDVRVRIKYPANSGSPTITSCSNDNFAIRPSSFALAVTDTDWSTAGLARTLNNVSTSGGIVHKAGSPFTLTISAYNAAATPAVTGNYALTPTVSVSSYLTPATCSTCSFSTGTFTVGAGTLASTTASYNEVGTFVLQAQDTTFASVDAGDSSTAERYITGTVNVGRFVPDHFDVSVGQNGAMQTACGTGFTYTGQGMAYKTVPTLTIMPMNAASGGSVTQNYTGVLQKLVASGIAITTPNADATTNGLDGSTKATLSAVMTAGTLTNASGTMTYTLNSSDSFTYTRNANALIAPFTSDIRLVVAAVAEPAVDGVTAGSLPTLRPTGVEIRYGRVRLVNAYGSELLDLSMTMRAEYWLNGGWQLNSADTCTDATLAFTAVGTDITGNTCVWDTGSAPGNSGKACSTPIVVSARKYKETGVAGFAGDFNLWLKAPGATHAGSLDITATVPAWLQFNWTGAIGNPKARATFGVYRSPLIYRRENY